MEFKWSSISVLRPVGGGGVLPILAYTGRLHPKGVPFFRLQVYNRVGISQVEVYKRVGEIGHFKT